MTKPLPQLIGVSGYARSGKDTFADALCQRFDYHKLQFTAPLNAILYRVNPFLGTHHLKDVVDTIGWEAAKDLFPMVRTFQQRLGQAVRDTIDPNIWLNIAMGTVDSTGNHWVIPNVRFLNEARAIRDRGGIVVRVSRPGVGPINDDISERELDEITFDYVVQNDGDVPALRKKAFDVIAKEQGTYVWPHQ